MRSVTWSKELRKELDSRGGVKKLERQLVIGKTFPNTKTELLHPTILECLTSSSGSSRIKFSK